MLVDSRADARRYFVEVWRKLQQGTVLEPLQLIVADVLRAHPETHDLMNDPQVLTREFAPDEGNANPFLHFGLHVSIREQLQTDRPAGVTAVYQQLLSRIGDRHAVEHRLMDCLLQGLIEAQQSGRMPDEVAYLNNARNLLRTW
jgi:hypothetical protein